MRIEQLEFLVEIAQKKSFNSASENLYLTPQSLSRSIASMENELGFKLFERNFRGVRFTNEGKMFLATAQEITKWYNKTLKEIHDYRQGAEELPASNLTIYANHILSMSILPDVITTFCKEYPQINVCLLEDLTNNILENLNVKDEDEHTLSVGIVTIPQTDTEMQKRYKEAPNQHFIPLFNGEYVCCVSKKSPLAAKRNISLKTICQYPLIRFTDSAGHVSDVQSHFLRKYGDVQIGFSTVNIGLWISAIANDIGIGLIHNIVLANKSLIRDKFEQISIIPIREKTTLETGLLLPSDSDKVIGFFAEAMQNYFRELAL